MYNIINNLNCVPIIDTISEKMPYQVQLVHWLYLHVQFVYNLFSPYNWAKLLLKRSEWFAFLCTNYNQAMSNLKLSENITPIIVSTRHL